MCFKKLEASLAGEADCSGYSQSSQEPADNWPSQE